MPQVLALLAIAVYWTVEQGGLAPTTWPPGALFLLALAIVAAAARGWRFEPAPRTAVVSIVCLVGFAAWNYASIAWAAVPGDAWTGANETLLYAVAFLLAVQTLWRGGSVLLTLGLYGAAVAIVGLVELVSTVYASNPAASFSDGRFESPLGYQNAEAAVFLAALWPLLAIVASREISPLLRGPAAGLSTVLVELALLGQSRGSALALPIVLVIYLALSPRRLRAALFATLPALGTALAAPRILHVYTALTGGGGGTSALHRALAAVVTTAVATTILGVTAALLDRQIDVGRRAMRVAVIAVSVAAVAAAGAGAVAAAHYDASGRIAHAWHQFKNNEAPTAASSHLVSGFGSNRYDFWRVAWHLFERHPVEGVGSDNFATFYVKERTSYEEPRYPHSVELRTVSQTGSIGTALLVVALGAALWLGLRGRKRISVQDQAARAAALSLFAYWLVHGSVDWFWEFPALTVPALCALGMAARVAKPADPTGAPGEPAGPRPARRTRRAALAATAVLLALAAGGSIALPWLSARAVAKAASTWATDPSGAAADLRLARRLNPLDDQADVTAGAIASRRHDWHAMQQAFARAARRNPVSWYTRLELAIADIELGRTPAARTELALARSLDPREPTLSLVADGIAHPRTFDPASVDRAFLGRG